MMGCYGNSNNKADFNKVWWVAMGTVITRQILTKYDGLLWEQ